jgi:acylphosphatase
MDLEPNQESCFKGTVSGVVQGVGFRAFVARSATALGLAGWVRNLPDGRVELAARGPRRQLTVLALALKKGPPGASVDDVSLDWGAGPGQTARFEIRR